jgi:hypothetical protein
MGLIVVECAWNETSLDTLLRLKFGIFGKLSPKELFSFRDLIYSGSSTFGLETSAFDEY